MKALRIALSIFLICLSLSLAYIFNKKPIQKDLLHVLRGHNDLVTLLAFSPNGKYLASADGSGVIRLWSTTSFKPVTQFQLRRPVSGVLFLPDNKTLVSSDFKGNLIFWNIKTHAIKWQYKADPILLMSASNNGTMVISTWRLKANEPENNQIVFIDYRKCEVIKKWKLGRISHRPKTVALSHNGKIAYITMEDVFLLKNVSDGRTIWKLYKPTYHSFMPQNGIEFSPDSERIATTYSGMNASAQIVRSIDGATVTEIGLNKTFGSGISVSQTPDGEKLLVLTTHNDILITDKNGKILKVHKGDSNANFESFQASPSGDIFAVSNRNNIEIWNIN